MVLERAAAARAIISCKPGTVLDTGKEVLTISVEMSFETESMPAHELSTVAAPLDDEAGHGFLFYANLGRPLVILKNLLQVARLVASHPIDTIETLCVLTGIIVDFKLVVPAHL